MVKKNQPKSFTVRRSVREDVKKEDEGPPGLTDSEEEKNPKESLAVRDSGRGDSAETDLDSSDEEFVQGLIEWSINAQRNGRHKLRTKAQSRKASGEKESELNTTSRDQTRCGHAWEKFRPSRTRRGRRSKHSNSGDTLHSSARSGCGGVSQCNSDGHPTPMPSAVNSIIEVHSGRACSLDEAEEWEELDMLVDSGAEENVCPKWWGESFGLDSSGRTLNLRSASGSRIAHWGEREVVVESPF